MLIEITILIIFMTSHIQYSSLLSCWLIVFHLLFGTGFSQDYQAIDAHARAVPSSYERNLESLVAYLVRPARSDRERARAMFTWITHHIRYDIQAYLSRTPAPVIPPETLLKQRLGVCQDYANLFMEMARLAGLACFVVEGWSKGYDYRVGLPLNGPPNHAWNAVKLEGQWYLVDCTWGAGYIDEQQKFVTRPNDFYFLPDPEQLIITHFPRNARWQLLDPPITRRTFEQFPLIRPAFFILGCRTSETKGTITTEQVARLHITTPSDVKITAVVVDQQVSGNRIYETTYKEYAFSQWGKDGWEVEAQFPQGTNYLLRLFGANRQQQTFQWIADFRVDSDRLAPPDFRYPQQFDDFFNHRAYLIKPRQFDLPRNQAQPFIIVVPGAQQVALVADNTWHMLTHQGNGRFEGTFTLSPGSWYLMARFPGNRTFQGLLTYRVP